MRIQQYHIGYILFALSVIALWLGISIGSAITDISLPIKALTAIFSEQDNYLLQIVTQIRIPRVIMAFIIGATLAISGASLQGICRNPLADPGLIGVSSGAAVGAVLAIVFANQIPYFDTIGSYLVPVAAFMGATITVFCVYWLAQSTYGMQIATFLLAGIAVNALAGAIIAMVNYIADDQSLRLIIFWMMGSLANSSWQSIGVCAPILVLCTIGLFRERHALNIILLGEANARFSGVNVPRLKNRILWLSALAVGVTVAFAGIIGFIGLAVPHILRLISDTNYRYLILNSALLGGALLIFADIGSRTIAMPAEVPIGIITALLGAPFFIGLIIQQKRNQAGLL